MEMTIKARLPWLDLLHTVSSLKLNLLKIKMLAKSHIFFVTTAQADHQNISQIFFCEGHKDKMLEDLLDEICYLAYKSYSC